MKRPSSFEIALSALACAVMTGALTLGAYVSFFLAGGYLLAAFVVMIPLAKDQWVGAPLASVGAGLLAFAFSGNIFTVLPFLVFFGLHPVVNRLQMKFVRKKLLHGLLFLGKAAWFDGTLLLMWFTLGELFGISEAVWYPYIAPYLYLTVFLGGTALFALYDWMLFLCQKGAIVALKRIGR